MGKGTSNSYLEAYWFAECVSSQQVYSNMFSLELQHQSHKQKKILHRAKDFTSQKETL